MRWLLLLAIVAGPAAADPAQIVEVAATSTDAGWRFDVTLRHGDTGWDDYADGWRVESPDGTVLGTRELLHPHVEEQPFTRSLGDVAVPEGLSAVMVRARTSVEGWGRETTRVALD